MADKTGISWTDATWNPVRGCSRVSEGCRNCYAERVAARFSGPGQPYEGLAQVTAPRDSLDRVGGRRNGWTGVVRLIPDHLADPLRWKKPRRIFVNSMSDLFHEKLTNEQIAAVFGVMAAAPQHTFQVLTKRATRMREWFEWVVEHGLSVMAREATAHAFNGIDITNRRLYEWWRDAQHKFTWPLPNVWLGVSVENQAAADERIPELLRTPAAVRFLSCEPLLGEVDLDMPRCDDEHHGPDEWGLADDEATPWCNECEAERSYGHWLHLDGGIDWVIAGCESGPGARACSVEWLRSLRDQCADAGVPYFLKQAVESAMGQCGDADNPNGDDPCGERVRYYVRGPSDSAVSCGCTVEGSEDADGCPPLGFGDSSKRKAGGVIELPYLDGVQHAAFPEV